VLDWLDSYQPLRSFAAMQAPEKSAYSGHSGSTRLQLQQRSSFLFMSVEERPRSRCGSTLRFPGYTRRFPRYTWRIL
jgi:hypothetical protein